MWAGPGARPLQGRDAFLRWPRAWVPDILHPHDTYADEYSNGCSGSSGWCFEAYHALGRTLAGGRSGPRMTHARAQCKAAGKMVHVRHITACTHHGASGPASEWNAHLGARQMAHSMRGSMESMESINGSMESMECSPGRSAYGP